MCRAVKCSNCGKATWAGCGKHIPQVMAKVPEAAQCTCRGPATVAGSSMQRAGTLRKLFRRT